VLNSVRGCVCIREAGGPRKLCELAMMAQVSNGISGLARNQAVLLILGLVIVLIGGVIFPAVWSSKRARRTAALAVLDRILRWRR
jgi:hypothetical protein